MKRKYGLSPERYNLMFMQQQGKCLICQESGRKLVVDHDHKTGSVRGLLCGHCNSMLGFSHDTPDTLRVAAGYLQAHKKEN